MLGFNKATLLDTANYAKEVLVKVIGERIKSTVLKSL